MQALTDFGGGIAWGTGRGDVGYGTLEVDCGSEPALESSEVFDLTTLGDGLLVGYQDRNSDYLLLYFRPR